MNKLKSLRAGFIAACAVSLSGCAGLSMFAHRDTNPLIQDITVGNAPWRKAMMNTWATTASRRMIIVKLDDYGKTLTTCAEPPPDVAETFASAVANAIAAKLPIKGVPVELSNQYARTVATQIAPLIFRSQGLQLYRDSMHGLCIDRLNGWTEADSYKTLSQYYFDKSIELIKSELTNIKDVTTTKGGDVSNIDTVVDSTVKLLNAVRPEAAPSQNQPAPGAAK